MPMEIDQFLSAELITKAIEELRARITKAETQRGDLDRVIAAARDEERLLLKLLSLKQGTVDRTVLAAEDRQRVAKPPAELPSDKEKPAAVEIALQEIAAAGRPVHISDLMRLLRDRRV